jgi:iron(III) transport system permease protein
VYGTIWILLIAYVGMFLPFAVRACVAANAQLDNSLEEAGRIGGARQLRIYRVIYIPLLAPALLSGGTIVFYHSMRELQASLLLYTTGATVMSVQIWTLFESGAYGQLFALAMLNVALTVAVVGLVTALARKLRNA